MLAITCSVFRSHLVASNFTNIVAGCLPIDHTLTAAQFLDHFVELIPGGVHVVGVIGIGNAPFAGPSRMEGDTLSSEETMAMAYSISTSLIRNLRDVFGENDPERQRRAIDKIFADDCVFYDPKGGVYPRPARIPLCIQVVSPDVFEHGYFK